MPESSEWTLGPGWVLGFRHRPYPELGEEDWVERELRETSELPTWSEQGWSEV